MVFFCMGTSFGSGDGSVLWRARRSARGLLTPRRQRRTGGSGRLAAAGPQRENERRILKGQRVFPRRPHGAESVGEAMDGSGGDPCEAPDRSWQVVAGGTSKRRSSVRRPSSVWANGLVGGEVRAPDVQEAAATT